MALILRQACEPILSDYDLDAYHADIDGKSKNMCLYTPCGKRFAVVHGVLFSRLHPTNSEVDYASELLSEWCARNSKKIDAYIKAFEILQRTPVPENSFKYAGAEVQISFESTREYLTGKGWIHFDAGINIVYKGVKQVWNTEQFLAGNPHCIRQSSVEEDTYLKGFQTIPATIKNRIRNRLEELVTYRTAKKTVDEILSDLNSCKE